MKSMKNSKLLEILELCGFIFSILSPIISGIYVNILTNKLINSKITLWKNIQNLGFVNLLLILIFLPIVFYIIEKKLNYYYYNIFSEKYQEKIINCVNNIFKITSFSISFYKLISHINIHYYSIENKDDEYYLIKERKYSYESKSLPKDFAFNGCKVDTKNIVMCEAFRNKSVTFKNLPENHNDYYDKNIRKYIDPKIKWVLASPVWKNNMQEIPEGVIVMYSSEQIANDYEEDKISELEQIGIELSKNMSNIIFELDRI
jgi:hypothetical protein